MSRAKNLSDTDIGKIVGILDGWSGPLRWESLIEAIEKRLYTRYTRQALHKHVRIKDAFKHKKQELGRAAGKERKTVASPELQLELDRNARLSAKCERLERENNAFLAQFARWAYNADIGNLTLKDLDKPLPEVNRGSDEKRVRRRTKRSEKDPN